MHHSSVSQMISLLYFFSWTFIWFLQKEPTNVQNFRLLAAQVKLHQIFTLIGSFRWKYTKFQLKKVQKSYVSSLHEKRHFRKSAQRKYHIFVIFRNWRKYHIFRKMKIKENIIFSIICDIFRNKSIKQGTDKKRKKWLED